jgi:prevent-host-death family protein
MRTANPTKTPPLASHLQIAHITHKQPILGEIMRHVTATELQRQFGRIKRIARREVVQVTDHGQVDFVMIPAEDYARMRRRDLTVAQIHDLPSTTIEAIMSAGLDHLPEGD